MQQETDELDFSKVYFIYFPKLVRFAREFVLSTEDAENIIQDIFLYLWEHRELLVTLNNPNAFLFTLVKNKSIDFLRLKKRMDQKNEKLETVLDKELQLKMYALQQFDENALSNDDIETLLNNAINKLPDKCREIFILSRMEGLKYKEIADRLEISTKTVENQISIALRKLKVELKDYLPLFIFIIWSTDQINPFYFPFIFIDFTLGVFYFYFVIVVEVKKVYLNERTIK